MGPRIMHFVFARKVMHLQMQEDPQGLEGANQGSTIETQKRKKGNALFREDKALKEREGAPA
jgi:hypothetical protein